MVADRQLKRLKKLLWQSDVEVNDFKTQFNC